MISIYQKILALLNPAAKRKFYLLMLMVLITGLLELLGVALIIPLFSLLAEEVSQAQAIVDWLGISRMQLFVLVGGLFLVKNIFLATTYMTLYRFAYGQVAEIRHRLHQMYVNTTRAEALLEHNSIKIKNIGENADRIARVVMVSSIQLLSEYAIMTLLLCYAFYMLPVIFIMQMLVGGVLTAGLIWLARNYIKRWGKRVNESYGNVIKIAKENIEGARELRLYKAVDWYTRKFDQDVHINSHHQALFFGVNNMPKLLLEFGIITLLLVMLASAQTTGLKITDLMLFGVVLIRVYPSISRVVSLTNALHFGVSVLDEIAELLNGEVSRYERGRMQTSSAAGDSIDDELTLTEIIVRDVRFSYPNSSSPIFEGLNLCLTPGITGLVGGSGAGKSTLLDIIIGVSAPQNGSVGFYVQREPFNPQKIKISYVAQKPHIFDGSIKENIALGIAPEAIDQNRVKAVLDVVKLTDLVKTLPKQEDEYIGEHAGLLSGGQGQRLAIARALYFAPDVLVMDEATSALDSKLETHIIDWLAHHSNIPFIVMSAHKISSLKYAHDIVVMENGQVVGQGDWPHIKANFPAYQNTYYRDLSIDVKS